MDYKELSKLEKLAKAATVGPWTRCNPPLQRTFVDGNNIVHLQVTESAEEADKDYIAAAHPKVILELISKIRRLEKLNNTWRYSDGMRHPLDMD